MCDNPGNHKSTKPTHDKTIFVLQSMAKDQLVIENEIVMNCNKNANIQAEEESINDRRFCITFMVNESQTNKPLRTPEFMVNESRTSKPLPKREPKIHTTEPTDTNKF
jgi:hypothetical protein